MKAYPEYKASGIDWLGDIPSHWEISKYKYHADSRMGITILKEQMVENGLPIYSATQDDSILGYTNNRSLLLHSGDFVIPARGNSIGYVTKVSFDEATCSQTTICSTNFRNICIDYLLFCCKCFKKDWFFFVDTAIPQITVSQVDNNILPLPSVAEQEAIAAYLDEQTGRIDALIEQKQKQVEDIRAYRTSLITETVTHGLNPDAPLRPSGIDWLGDIPEHWQRLRFKYFLDQITSPSTAIRKVALENIESQTGRYIETNSEFEGDGVGFILGDIVYGKLRPYLKKVWLAEFEGNAIGDFFVYRAKENANNNYIKWLFLTEDFTSIVNQSTNGAKMPRVSSDFIKDLDFFLPPIEEQETIAAYLDDVMGKVDALISELTKQIDELTEYKQAVITEAVTGKVDVRDWKTKN